MRIYCLQFTLVFLVLVARRIFAEESQASIESPPPPSIQSDEDPKFRYAIILDVGSTGTRTHIYAFEWHPTKCWGRGAVHIMMPGWSKKVKPGLAHLWQSEIAKSEAPDKDRKALIQRYLNDVKSFIFDTLKPEHSKIILVRATGGFRYLSEKSQNEILDLMHEEIDSWELAALPRTRLKVLSGNEEGAYSWLAINQLARRFFDPYEHVALHPLVKGVSVEDRAEITLPGIWLKDNWKAEAAGQAGRRLKRRVGIVEMGGASAQIALEPPSDLVAELLRETDVFDLRRAYPILQAHPRQRGFHLLHFCHENLILQLRSLDGFGRQAALMQFLKAYADTKHVKAGETFQAPCLPSDIIIPIHPKDNPIISEDFVNATGTEYMYATGADSTTAEECRQAVRAYIGNEEMPPLPFELDPHYRIYATENFYYFNKYVANATRDPIFSAASFWEKAQELCGISTAHEVHEKLHTDAALEKSHHACFGLIFLSEFLKSIVNVPETQLLKGVTAIKDLETSFAVGCLLAELPMLISGDFPGDHDEL